MRLINAEALKDDLAVLFERNKRLIDDWLVGAIDDTIDEQPDAGPNKWLKISPAGIYECSACGQNVMTGDIAAYKYCHGCGARMGGTT